MRSRLLGCKAGESERRVAEGTAMAVVVGGRQVRKRVSCLAQYKVGPASISMHQASIGQGQGVRYRSISIPEFAWVKVEVERPDSHPWGEHPVSTRTRTAPAHES